jgi:hypothetical protein
MPGAQSGQEVRAQLRGWGRGVRLRGQEGEQVSVRYVGRTMRGTTQGVPHGPVPTKHVLQLMPSNEVLASKYRCSHTHCSILVASSANVVA